MDTTDTKGKDGNDHGGKKKKGQTICRLTFQVADGKRVTVCLRRGRERKFNESNNKRRKVSPETLKGDIWVESQYKETVDKEGTCGDLVFN